jgi:hypothetical protein
MANDQNSNIPQEFSTMDIYLTAFLSRKGLDCRLETSDRGKVMFVFNKEEAFAHMDESTAKTPSFPSRSTSGKSSSTEG